MRRIKLFLALLAAVVLVSGDILLFARGGGGGGRGGRGDREERGDSEAPGEEGDQGGPGETGEERPDGGERGGGRGGGRGDRGGEGADGMGEEGPEGEGPGGGRKGDRGRGEGDAPDEERPDYETCIEQAGEMVAQKEYKSAAEEYNRALMGLSGDDSRKVYVYERLGWLAVKEKDYDGALGFYQTAIYQAEKLDISDKTAVNAYRGAAYCREKDGDIKGAVANYEMALKLAKNKAVRNDIRKKLAPLKARLKKAAGKDKARSGKPPEGRGSAAPVKQPSGKAKQWADE